jgi:DNA-binding transcriptional regulator YdaS (Cro superfamily)
LKEPIKAAIVFIQPETRIWDAHASPPDMRALAKRGIAALELAVFIAGNQTNLARLIGTTDQRVSHWKLRDLAIPVDRVPEIVAALQHPMITPYTLRPDLAPFWDLLTPQLAACSKGRARVDLLTQEDFEAVAAVYPGASPAVRANKDARTEAEASA